ncbi:MAG TPA: hypothetical protein DD670_01835 [Planctomycetaceae bacterium]|nr:hypothetical protein [Planctomycetaceae bacterium]
MTAATSSRRQGYAMVLVLVFIALVNLFFVLSYKHLSSALRVQIAHRLGRECDEGPVAALAAGLALLELTEPVDQENGEYDYQYTILIGGEPYTVIFTPPSEGEQSWSVHARSEEPTDLPNLRDLREEIDYLQVAIAAGRAQFDPDNTETHVYALDPYYTVTFSQVDPPTDPRWRMTTRRKPPE